MPAEGNLALAFSLNAAAGLATTVRQECVASCGALTSALQASSFAPTVPPPCPPSLPLLPPQVGACVVFCVHVANKRFLAGSLGFSAGVML